MQAFVFVVSTTIKAVRRKVRAQNIYLCVCNDTVGLLVKCSIYSNLNKFLAPQHERTQDILHDLLNKNVREHWAHKYHLLPFNIV